MFSVKFHLALDTHTVTLDSNALDLIDYTLTVVASKKKKKKKLAPAPALTVDPTRPWLASSARDQSSQADWNGSVHPTPPKPLLAFNSPGDTPFQPPGSSRCTRRPPAVPAGRRG
jgi:hypothetical protein